MRNYTLKDNVSMQDRVSVFNFGAAGGFVYHRAPGK